MNDRHRLEVLATGIVAAAAFLIPLVHSGSIVEPFFFPKMLVIVATAFALGILAIACYLYGDLHPGPTSFPLWLGVGVVLLHAVAIGTADNRTLALWGTLDIAAGVVVFWGVARFFRSPDQAATVLIAYLAGTTLAACGALAQVFIPGAHLFAGPVSILPPSQGGSTLGDTGLLAECLILALPLGVGAAALVSGWRRVACGVAIGIVSAAILFTGRPEGWIVALLSAGLLILTRVVQALQSERGWRALRPDPAGHSLWAGLSALIILLIILSVSRWTALGPTGTPTAPLQGATLLSPTTGDPDLDRSAAVRGSLALIRAHPLGVGPDNWRHAFLEVAWTKIDDSPFTLSHQAVHAGNNFLEIAAESGAIGGLGFLALVVILLAQAGLAAGRGPLPWRQVGLATFNAASAVVFMALLGAPFEEPTPSFVFWVAAGLTQAALAGSSRREELPSILSVEPREPLPRRLRRRRLAAAAGLAVLALAGLVGWAATDRYRAGRQALVAQAAYLGGNYEAALRRLGQPALRRSPDPVHSARAGSSYLRLGFPKLAVREFTETLERSPHFIAAHLGRAMAHEELGRYDLAEEDLGRALAIWPGNIETLLARARLNTTRGRLDDAIQNYMDIARADPDLAEPFFRAGMIFMRRNQLDEAIQAFRLARQKNPRYPRLALELGNALYRKGFLEMALRQYQMAAGQDPRNVETRLKIANTHHALQQPCDALQALEAARDLETDGTQRGRILDLIDQIRGDCDRKGAS